MPTTLPRFHEWQIWKFISREMECCKHCGILRRPGKMPVGNDDKPCKGTVRVTLR